LATIVVVIVTLGVAAKITGTGWLLKSGGTAIIVTPVLWWWLVGRKERPGLGWGFLAGGIAGAAAPVLWMLPRWISNFWINAEEYSKNAGLGAAAEIAIAGYIVVSAVIAAVICAVAGVAIVLVERRART
jgi:hypothetical protein